MNTDELREKYLTFFESKGCVRQPSDVLVPTWDPSVLFTPAGMNQFKDHFLGKVKLDFKRATTCQKCLRTGDIDNVGRTAYHHTFFEMLGNFSFGDYFKEEAICWAWEFLTDKKWLALDPDRLSVTVYLDDDEAATIWRDRVGLSESQITREDEDENFWPASAITQGPDGVCGPCSEIYYEPPSGKKVEIWNLVFTQFNRVGDPPDNLRPLPSKNIDTGMGLERCASVLQGVETNFHIDILKPLVLAAGEVVSRDYQAESDVGRRLRRIADHVRACTFAIFENVYPGPNKAQYVIRRLLRRAVLDGYQLEIRHPFLFQLVPTVIDLMKTPYPELVGEGIAERIQGVMRQEEQRFFDTIESGLKYIEQIFREMASEGRIVISGKKAWYVYETYGFPGELFEQLAKERGLTFDWDGFGPEEGEETAGPVGIFKKGPIDTLKESLSGTKFLGYETTEATAVVGGLILREKTGDPNTDKLVDSLDQTTDKQQAIVVLDQSPFYAESGGQVGDSGWLTAEGLQMEVTDTQKDGDLWLHFGQIRQGTIKTQLAVTATVDAQRRQGIRRAHSATHLLHHALQTHVGKHAQQKGSKVDEDLLRFDFTNMEPVEPEVLAKIEDDCNDHVIEAAPVTAQQLKLAEARAAGAMMLFGEKYPEVVRMVSMGDFSKELCGGIHLENTGQVGLLKILKEEGVSAGVRRITALTGQKAVSYVRQTERQLASTAGALKTTPEQVPERVAALVKEVKELKKQLASGPAPSGVSAESLLAEAPLVDGVRVVTAEIPGMKNQGLLQLIDQLRRGTEPVAAMLFGKSEESVAVAAGLSRAVAQRGVNAGNWLRSIIEIVGGKGGGGRAESAQGGGKNPEGIPQARTQAVEVMTSYLQASDSQASDSQASDSQASDSQADGAPQGPSAQAASSSSASSSGTSSSGTSSGAKKKSKKK